MKLNENFNAGATKKKTGPMADPLAAAINGNFTQSQAETPVRASPQPAPAVQTVQATQPAVQPQVQQPKPAEAPDTEKKTATPREKKDSFLVYMSKGERSIFKSYCALQDVSMNHFVICAMDYFKEEMEKGKVVITKHGYKRQ